MNILLIAVSAKYIHSNPAVFSLKSCTGAYSPHVSILEFTINQQPSFMLQQIYKKHPDVIAFSCYIWNRSTIDCLIPDLHKLLPDTDIWAGGPEVSYNAGEIISRWQLRGVMAGPGEGSFSCLVSAYMNGTADRLPAILDSSNAPVLSLDEIPFWQENLNAPDSRIIYYESSRGCPFSCSYCLSSIDKTMDFRSTERVCKELDFFLERKVPQVKFIDRTFNCSKAHALPILRHILDHDNGVTNFHFEIAADLLDEDYFALLRQMRLGAVQLEIGIQSTCAQTIAEIRRKTDFEKAADAVRRIGSWHNIHVHLDLIAGLPYEDLDTFQNSFNEVYALHPEQLQLGFLKVLKGSGMERNAAEYGLLYTSLPPYEVLCTRWLSYEDVCHLKQTEDVLEIYYNSGQFMHTMEFLCHYFETPYAMYASLGHWYEAHGLSGIQSSRVRKYEILLEFGSFYIQAWCRTQKNLPSYETYSFTPDRQICALKEYLTYDLYLREHMKNRPAFCLSLDSRKDVIHDILYQEAQNHTLFPELSGCNYRTLMKLLHAEIFETIFSETSVILFCYEKRDPLTNNGCIKKITLNSLHALK